MIRLWDSRWLRKLGKTTSWLENLVPPIAEASIPFKVAVEMPLIQWYWTKLRLVKEETVACRTLRISNKLTSSFGALQTIITLQVKIRNNSTDNSRQIKSLTPWSKNKNSQTLIMVNFHQITWVLPSMDMLSTKPETYQVKEMNKNRRHLTLDRHSFISELMNRLTNHRLTNIVLQLLIMEETRSLQIWLTTVVIMLTWLEEKLNWIRNQLRIKLELLTFPLVTSNSNNQTNLLL